MSLSSFLPNPYKAFRLNRSSFIDNVFRDKVKPVPGSVVMCDLTPLLEHSGIYVGGNTIIHRTGDRTGFIEEVSPKKFIDRFDGFNNAISIYVACKDDKPISFVWADRRARNALDAKDQKGYSLLSHNCHNFTRYCITGEKKQDWTDFTFSSLEDLLWSEFGFNNWRVWDIELF